MTMIYQCPGCGTQVRMKPQEFPLTCRCGHVSEDGGDSAPPDARPQPKPAPPRVPLPKGPGDFLKEILAAKGAKAHQGCGCESMARRMNVWGPQGCREHRGEIIDQFPASRDGATFRIRPKSSLSPRRARVFLDPSAAPDGLSPVRLKHPETDGTRV